MLYSCTHMATVDVRGLKLLSSRDSYFWRVCSCSNAIFIIHRRQHKRPAGMPDGLHRIAEPMMMSYEVAAAVNHCFFFVSITTYVHVYSSTEFVTRPD